MKQSAKLFFTFCDDNIKQQLIFMIFLMLDNENIELVA